MANYFLNVEILNRKRRSLANAISYMCGRRLHDNQTDKEYYHERTDVDYCRVFLPENAPERFNNIQKWCDEIEIAEIRKDATTARLFVGSLPNEISTDEQIQIVEKFIKLNFVDYGLCAFAAIHNGVNINEPSKNNPHTHILVSTRTVDADGFSKRKFREHNKHEYIYLWRKSWADLQNEVYIKNKLDIRVSHESLERQGIDREPMARLSLEEWELELRGNQTFAGNKNRAIKERNSEREYQKEHERDLDRSR